MTSRIARSSRALAAAAAVGILGSLSAPALAQNLVTGTTSIVTDPGTTQQTDGPLTGFMTTGADMAGISVRVVFVDSTEETVAWVPVLGPVGAAVGTNWFLSNIGDTFFFPWRLQNLTGKGIARVEIDGQPGNTLFDLTFGGIEGSPGSDRGHTFEVLSGQGNLDIRATYRDIVGVDGATPVGDLFRRLTIEIIDPTGLPSRLTALRFMADTDNAVLAGDVDECCQPWDNGRFDERHAQTSHEGQQGILWEPFQRITADDMWLCESQIHRIDIIRGIMCTDSTVPKAKVVIYADCNGRPGEIVAEASAVRSLDDGLEGTVYVEEAGRPFAEFRLIAVEARFDKVFLKGGAYWVSFVGFSGTGNQNEQFFWGSSGNGVIKGRPGQFFDSDVGSWESVETLCCGCTDFNFCAIGESCKILLDNGGPSLSSSHIGLPSLQNGARTSDRVRSADQFVVPPCQDVAICHLEGHIWTNCDRVGLDIFTGDCHCPAEREPILSLITDCVIDLGEFRGSGSTQVELKRAIFADFLPSRLPAGRNYWVSIYGIGDGRQNARAYFAHAQLCDDKCIGHFGPACTKGAPYATGSWIKNPDGAELSFLIAVAPAADRPPVVTAPPAPTPLCAADVNADGALTVQDLFDFLAAFFGGCP